MESAAPPSIANVAEADFDRLVIQRSHEVPVVVDFWAEWCAPCRSLGPVLELAVLERTGKVELAKVDVDANQALAARYSVKGIPAVKAFRAGQVTSEFTGVAPPDQVERFLDALQPSEAEQLAAAAAISGDEDGLRRALELDSRLTGAAAHLAHLLLLRGEPGQALKVVQPLAGTDFVCTGLVARARLELSDDAPTEAFAALDEGDVEGGLEALQQAVAAAAPDDRRDLLRRVMIGVFTELGPDSELARTHRRRLATVI